MTFASSVLGEVSHPINVLREYLKMFKNKCQAAIVSWLDGWTHTKRSQGQDEWVWLTLDFLAKELGYCKDTIHTHLKKLLKAGVIERKPAKRWPTDNAWSYRLVPQEIKKNFTGENQTADKLKPDCQQPENQTVNSLLSDHIHNSSPNPVPKPNPRRAEEFFQEEEIIDNSKEFAEEISQERKQEILVYMGVSIQEDQSSAPEFLGEKIPVNLQSKLDEAGIKVDKEVREAIASHHISQSLSAAQHCIDTADSIKNPKGVFLFQISRQPVEQSHPCSNVFAGAGKDWLHTGSDGNPVAPCPPHLRKEIDKILGRVPTTHH